MRLKNAVFSFFASRSKHHVVSICCLHLQYFHIQSSTTYERKEFEKATQVSRTCGEFQSNPHISRMRILTYKMSKPKEALIYGQGSMLMQKNTFLKSYHTVFFNIGNTGSAFGPILVAWPYYSGCPRKDCVVGFQKCVFLHQHTSLTID